MDWANTAVPPARGADLGRTAAAGEIDGHGAAIAPGAALAAKGIGPQHVRGRTGAIGNTAAGPHRLRQDAEGAHARRGDGPGVRDAHRAAVIAGAAGSPQGVGSRRQAELGRRGVDRCRLRHVLQSEGLEERDRGAVRHRVGGADAGLPVLGLQVGLERTAAAAHALRENGVGFRSGRGDGARIGHAHRPAHIAGPAGPAHGEVEGHRPGLAPAADRADTGAAATADGLGEEAVGAIARGMERGLVGRSHAAAGAAAPPVPPKAKMRFRVLVPAA